jgi:CubicO group peptidase (beta-lactamase class C family)
MKLIKMLLSGLLVGACAAAVEAPAREESPVYPGTQWQTGKPDQVGLDAGKLMELSDYAGGFGCVVRHGYMVYTWGDASTRKDVASAAKPFYAHFLFKAVEDGKIPSLDERVNRWEPRLNEINKERAYKDRDIRWRHLVNQTSCYGLAEAPGTAYAYNDWQMALFWDTLFQKVYGARCETVDAEVLHPMLTDPLQCQDNPTFMAFGIKDRPGRLAISPRDFARFGLLYLREGKWKDKQLLSREHAKMAVTNPLPNSIPRTTGQEAEMIPHQRSMGSKNIPDDQCDHIGSYSWLWWTNGISRDGARHWPDVPTDTYGCFGHGGLRAMIVMPGLDLIVSWNDAKIRSAEMENYALKLLKDSVTSPGPKRAQIIVDPEHPQWFKRKDGGPFFICGPGDPEDFLYRGTLQPDGTRDGDQMALIDKLKGTGANCIYLMAVRSHGGDGDKTHNPFVDNDPRKGINPKVLAQWETWFTEMDKNGIVIYLFFYDDNARIWSTGDTVGTEERELIRTLVNRFEHHGNLIWCIAEEYQEKLSIERVKNIAAEIRAADDYDHAITVHKLNGLDFSEFADEPNIDQFAIQYNVKTAEELHAGVVKAWKQAQGKYSLTMSEAADYGAGEEARKKSWACAMGGAYVMILGMDIAATPRSNLEDCGRLVRFFESTDFNAMSPADELRFAGTQYVLARPGESYIACASQLRGEIGLRNMSPGVYKFRWFDCGTGKEVTQGKMSVPGGGQSWNKPSGIGNELAVYIKRIRQ